MSVTVKDRGWEGIKRDLKNLDKYYTKVGLPENGKLTSPKRKSNTPEITDFNELIQIAAINEFGSSGGLIPERSFLRSATDDYRPQISALQEKMYNEILVVRKSAKDALSVIGEFLTAKVKGRIRDINYPPNAPSTIKRKKSSNPLIDKAQMIQSIQHVEITE